MTTPFDADDELRARLHASDPAASLPPADPAGVARLLEDVMSTELTTENRETGTRNRGPLTWLVAAAAVLIIAGVTTFALVGRGDSPATPPAAAPSSTVTDLTGADAAAYDAKCMVPNATTLASDPTAFDGTVTSIEGSAVTLTPSHWYAGSPTDLVRVTAPGATWEQLLSAVHFEAGARYLVSATDDGTVTVCGFSAPYSSSLAAIYAQAFPG